MERSPVGGDDVGSTNPVFAEPVEILERISDAFYALDEEWQFRYVNERAETLLQRSEERLLGQSIWDAFPEARDTAVWERYHEAMRTQESVSFELYYEPLGGRFEVNAHPSETGLSVYFRDVTEERERERRLRESQRRYQTLVDNVPNGAVVLFDHDLRFLVSGGDADDLDVTETDTLEGQTLTEALSDDVAALAKPHYEAALRGETREFQHTLDGRIRHVHVVPVRAEDGTVLAGLAISQDVTDRVRPQRELESRTRQQEIIAELGRLALNNPPLDDLFGQTTETVAEALDADYCELLAFDPEAGRFHLRSGVGWRPGAVGEATVPDDERSQAGYTLLSSDPVVVENLGEETRFSDFGLLADHDVSSGITTIVGPVDDPWGILGVHDTEPRSFTERDVDFVQSVANVLATAIDRHERERELRSQRERLRALNDVNSLVQQISESVVKESSRAEIERLVCEELAASDSYVFAWVGEADEERGEVVLRAEAGVEDYLSDIHLALGEGPGESGPTVRALRTGEMQSVTDVQTHEDYAPWRDHAARYGYRSSAAIPIAFDGTQYGVLNVYSARPAAFGSEERTAFSRLGTIVGHALRSVERDRQLRDSERRYRTLAENIPNGAVTLLDRDLRYVLAAGSSFDSVDLQPADVVGRRVGELNAVPKPVLDQVEDALQRALDGETNTVEVAYDGRVFEYRAVPVRDDDGVSAAMSLSQDITDRVRHEEELEHERERLELMNRLVRHNLLNSLNVVDARLEIVADGVDDAVAGHLETARRRTDSMVELVETMRSLMKALVETDDVVLEPVSLDGVVRRELADARDAFPEAVFSYEESTDATVEANELLDELVENLLTNAVQHNDASTPRVVVSVDADEDTVTLRVADNGPGVDPEQGTKIFDKGTKGFESPGTGFGLHLVREIAEAYGGDVSVENDASSDGPSGATFRVTLPRAPDE
ncbi:PAS domain-containing protein [Halogeometricum limi]|uniref:histidine kinase n=1 Tax=Halogeometricum limi TaxID=555875 RepID=A0A1I6GZ35_9EURY|nr:PAS domain-containing protein [Halogeometricum limi]SFR47458.1 PAS domain S-box-containing protein [Halogeometricum limi]